MYLLNISEMYGKNILLLEFREIPEIFKKNPEKREFLSGKLNALDKVYHNLQSIRNLLFKIQIFEFSHAQ